MSNTTVEKLVKISEEVQKPIHVPIFFGNDCFIVTQQDMRKIENIRLLTYSKLAPNGDLIPAQYLGHEAHIRDAIFNACKYRIQVDQSAGISDINMLANLLNKLCAPQGNEQEIDMTVAQATPAVATLQQQLQWEKVHNSALFPFSHTIATSTDEASAGNTQNKSNGCGCCCCCSSKNTKSCSRGSNTMDVDDSCHVCDGDGPLSAREQLKKKKLCQGLCCV